jgi:hypothetical protein
MPEPIDAPNVLRIRFIGPALNERGVPIYELGKSLVAIQQMVHKARMLEKRNEARRPFLTFDERAQFALQIADRRRGSDEYGLTAFLANPITTNAIGNYIAWIMGALSVYAVRSVLKKGAPKDDRQHVFNIYVFNQLGDLAGRINNVGGIDAIEVASSVPRHKTPVRLDAEFKHYVNSIKDEVAYGALREITGRLVDLVPGEDAVKISRQPEGVIKVMLSPADFRTIRYSELKNPLIRVVGEPVYRLGVETYYYEAFNAHSMEIISEPPDKSQLPQAE